MIDSRPDYARHHVTKIEGILGTASWRRRVFTTLAQNCWESRLGELGGRTPGFSSRWSCRRLHHLWHQRIFLPRGRGRL